MRLPFYLQRDFFQVTKDFNMLDGSINFVTLEKWLDKQIKSLFNPLADIISDKKENLYSKNNLKPKIQNKHFENIYYSNVEENESNLEKSTVNTFNKNGNNKLFEECEIKKLILDFLGEIKEFLKDI